MRGAIFLCAVVLLTLPAYILASCHCNGIINKFNGQGECRSTYKGRLWCYVDQARCQDETSVLYKGKLRFWSHQACGVCRKVRVRKNVQSLGRHEKWRLISALKSAIHRKDFQAVGNYHGFPATICKSNGTAATCCPHGTIDFLPWHRLYMVQMEETLGEALPFYDWTETSNIPGLWEDIVGSKGAPIQQGHKSLPDDPENPWRTCPPGNPHFIRRASNISIPSDLLKNIAREAFKATDIEEFSSAISVAHNIFHVTANCDMFDLETSAYDPLFYLHHTYVDQQFAFWQELQKLRELDDPDLQAFDKPLQPFNHTKFNKNQKTLWNNRGRDTFDYKNNFCYMYDKLLFDNMTPSEFLSNIISLGGNDTGGVFAAVVGGGDPIFFIGVVLPKIAPSGIHFFELCQADACVAAGEVATFGARSAISSATVSKNTHYITEVDVTEIVEEQDWFREELTTRLTNRTLQGVPEPVVIQRYDDGTTGGTVTLGSGQQPQDYGDLLAIYTIDSV